MLRKPTEVQQQHILGFLLAAKDGFVSLVREYIRAGGDVNAVLHEDVRDFFGDVLIPAGSTALMVATMYAKTPVVTYLFKEVPDIDLFVRNSLGKNAFECVFAAKNVATDDADFTALALDDIACLILDAAKTRRKELILMGNNLPTETPALLWATEKGLMQTVVRLNQLGVPCNLKHKPLDRKIAKLVGSDKCDPLHAAIVNDHVALAIMFMDGEAKVNEDLQSTESNDLIGQRCEVSVNEDLQSTESNHLLYERVADDQAAAAPKTHVVRLIQSAPNTDLSNEVTPSEFTTEDGIDVFPEDLILATHCASMDMIKAIYSRLETLEQFSLDSKYLLQNILNRHSWLELNDGSAKVKLYDPRSGYIAKGLIELLGQPIQEFDDSKQSLIFYAVQSNGAFIDYLVQHGISVTTADDMHCTPIMNAALLGGLATMPALIQHGAQISDLHIDDLAKSRFTFQLIDNESSEATIFVGSLLAFAVIGKHTTMLQQLLNLDQMRFPQAMRIAQLQQKLYPKTDETYSAYVMANKSKDAEYETIWGMLAAAKLVPVTVAEDTSESNANTSKPRGSSLIFSSFFGGTPTTSATNSASPSRTSSRPLTPVQTTMLEPETPSSGFWRKVGSPVSTLSTIITRSRPDSPQSIGGATTPSAIGTGGAFSPFNKLRRSTAGQLTVRTDSPQMPANSSTPQTPATAPVKTTSTMLNLQ